MAGLRRPDTRDLLHRMFAALAQRHIPGMSHAASSSGAPQCRWLRRASCGVIGNGYCHASGEEELECDLYTKPIHRSDVWAFAAHVWAMLHRSGDDQCGVSATDQIRGPDDLRIQPRLFVDTVLKVLPAAWEHAVAHLRKLRFEFRLS